MKPILFNTAMVRAILDGRKTVTRRVVKTRNTEILDKPKWAKGPYWFDVIKTKNGQKIATADVILPPYNPGDILYVRETWCRGLIECGEESDGRDALYITQRDGENDVIYKEYAKRNDIGTDDVKWQPSIFMPKEAARIFLRVTNVRVERLQDITPEQIDAEGCKEYAYSAETGELQPSKPTWFQILWDSTVKYKEIHLYGWNANPWVWVIEFEKIGEEEARACEVT
jgi:hypothetical protein